MGFLDLKPPDILRRTRASPKAFGFKTQVQELAQDVMPAYRERR
jgi:hypothetical protein